MEATNIILAKHTEDRKAADENLAAFRRAMDSGHDKYIETAKKCNNFYMGEQWDPLVRRELEREGRPVLTINAVLAAVNTVLGEQANQRMDIVFKPRRDAVQATADTLTKVTMQVQDNNKYEQVERTMFSDGVIEDRGWVDIRIGFEDNLQGEIRITSEDPVNVLPDPGASEYDPRTWNEVTKVRWLTLDEIALLYGVEKARAIQAFSDTSDYDYPQDTIRYERDTYGGLDKFMAHFSGAADTKVIRRVLVIERQFKKITPVSVFVDPNTGDTRPVPEDWEDEKVAAFAKKYGLAKIRRLQKKIRWTVSVGPVALHDAWSPYKTFTLIPYFPYFRRGKPMGMVRNLLSPQEQLNKVESQQLHVVNTTANSGWVIEAGSLTNMTDTDLEERGAETGIVLVYGKGRPKPEKISANSIPTGLDRLGSKALDNIREIAGVTSMLGVDSPEVSGVALGKKQSRGLIQMQPLFDSLGQTRQLVAEKILELIQDFYTETRVLRITNWGTPENESEEVVINGINAAGELINNVTLGEYDTVVSTAPARDNFEETQFAEALQLREAGVAIPDYIVIESSHLANKHDIARLVRQQQGMAEPTPEQLEAAAQQAEVEYRTAVAALAELEGKAEKHVASAELDYAKAEAARQETDTSAQEFGAEMRLRIEQLRADTTKARENLINKLQLAGLHVEANREQTLYKETSKRLLEQAKLLQASKVEKAPTE